MPVALGSTALTETFVPQARARAMPVLRAGHTAGFVWGFTAAQYPRTVLRVRFTDDDGLDWEIGNDLQLKKLDYRDW